MKIGIVTQPLKYNYGGVLQNFALQQTLISYGHEVITIDQKEKILFKYYIVNLLSAIKTLVYKAIGRGQNRYFPETGFVKRKRGKKITQFVEQNIIKSEPLSKDKAFSEYIKYGHFDVIVVGSDQVWRPRFNRNIKSNFLEGCETLNIRRIAYAASFGVDNWEFNPEETAACRELIQKFDFVGVREVSGVNLCKKFLGYDNAQLVLDPTLLHKKEFYLKLIKDSVNPKAPYLLTYILNKSAITEMTIQYITKNKKLPVLTVAHEHREYPSIEEWLCGFASAEFVVCDSFHAVVFSIIFNKEFIVVGNVERGLTRFQSVLKLFGLENRLITDINQLKNIGSIEWDDVNDRLGNMREYSISWLVKYLN